MDLKLHVLHMNQCDPKKCTAKKLQRHGLVRIHKTLRSVPIRSIKLNPFAEKILGTDDADAIKQHGLTVIDCSWKHAESVFGSMKLKNDRRLSTIFLAGNPINYAMPGKLSSVEALAASLIVAGFFEEAESILSKFSWGHTFLSLNKGRIDDFKKGNSDIKKEIGNNKK